MGFDPEEVCNKTSYEVIKDSITCIICSLIVSVPKQCSSCENPFCKECIDSWTKMNPTCPFKCSDFSIYEANRVLKNLLDKLEFMCPNCEGKFSFEKYEFHRDLCTLKISDYKNKVKEEVKYPSIKDLEENNKTVHNSDKDKSYMHNKVEEKKKEYIDLIQKIKPLNDGIEVEYSVIIDNKGTYYGEVNVKNGLKHGRGIIHINENKAVAEGIFVNDKMNGFGKYTHENGDIFEGMFVNDKANGYGTYLTKNGSKYSGNWADDVQHGFGEEVFPDGAIYKGEYYKGAKEGEGIFIWADKSKYEGIFVDNKLQGKGMFNYK